MANGDRADSLAGAGSGGGGERATGGPDPSVATGATILREIAMLEANLSGRIDGNQEVIRARLDAMDKAIAILAQFPTEVDKAVSALQALIEAKLDGLWTVINRHQFEIDRVPAMRNETVVHVVQLTEEKFTGISTQFKERDTREERTAREGKEAIAAALQAQKEAVGKTETGFEKRIDQIGTLITTSIAQLATQITAVERASVTQIQSTGENLGQQIGDLKERLTQIESSKKGSDDSWKGALAVVAAIVALLGLGLGVISFAVK